MQTLAKVNSPAPDLIFPGPQTDAEGEFELTVSWPSDFPLGLTRYIQVLIDGPNPGEYIASNAVAATPR